MKSWIWRLVHKVIEEQNQALGSPGECPPTTN